MTSSIIEEIAMWFVKTQITRLKEYFVCFQNLKNERANSIVFREN